MTSKNQFIVMKEAPPQQITESNPRVNDPEDALSEGNVTNPFSANQEQSK